MLPASQYSVLDAQRIERLDEDTFRCYVGGLRFLGLEVEPVITVSVTVQERGPTVRLLSTKVGRQQPTGNWLCCRAACCLPAACVLPAWKSPGVQLAARLSLPCCTAGRRSALHPLRPRSCAAPRRWRRQTSGLMPP